jgi:hypothetical protein
MQAVSVLRGVIFILLFTSLRSGAIASSGIVVDGGSTLLARETAPETGPHGALTLAALVTGETAVSAGSGNRALIIPAMAGSTDFAAPALIETAPMPSGSAQRSFEDLQASLSFFNTADGSIELETAPVPETSPWVAAVLAAAVVFAIVIQRQFRLRPRR